MCLNNKIEVVYLFILPWLPGLNPVNEKKGMNGFGPDPAKLPAPA